MRLGITRAVSQNGVTGWTLNPTWKNTGGTDAVDLRSWWALQIVEGAEWTAKRCPAVAAPGTGLVALHSDYDFFGSGGIGAAHFGAGLVCCEHPFDAGAGGISPSLPGGVFAA